MRLKRKFWVCIRSRVFVRLLAQGLRLTQGLRCKVSRFRAGSWGFNEGSRIQPVTAGIQGISA